MLAVGFVLGDSSGDAEPVRPSFHDIRVIHPEDFQSLIAPEAPEVVALARQLGSLEAAYDFVRDRIAFEPSAPAGAPAQTLREGRASCLGKATLLASLFRALGVPAGSVRVVTGQVPLGDSLLDHAWVDLEYGSLCLQLDPTDLLGTHDFLRFPGTGVRAQLCFARALLLQRRGLRRRLPTQPPPRPTPVSPGRSGGSDVPGGPGWG